MWTEVMEVRESCQESAHFKDSFNEINQISITSLMIRPSIFTSELPNEIKL